MKKIILTFSFAVVGMMTGAYAQQEGVRARCLQRGVDA